MNVVYTPWFRWFKSPDITWKRSSIKFHCLFRMGWSEKENNKWNERKINGLTKIKRTFLNDCIELKLKNKKWTMCDTWNFSNSLKRIPGAYNVKKKTEFFLLETNIRPLIVYKNVRITIAAREVLQKGIWYWSEFNSEQLLTPYLLMLQHKLIFIMSFKYSRSLKTNSVSHKLN